MTRRDTIQCIHEPFGDAFYYGPERLSARFADDEQARLESGFSQSTFQTVLARIEREASEVRPFFLIAFLAFAVLPCVLFLSVVMRPASVQLGPPGPCYTVEASGICRRPNALSPG